MSDTTRTGVTMITLDERTAAVAVMAIEGRTIAATCTLLGMDRAEVRRLRHEAYAQLSPAKYALIRANEVES